MRFHIGYRTARRQAKSTALRCQATAAQDLLDQGRQKYEGGDRMGALKLFEKTLQQACFLYMTLYKLARRLPEPVLWCFIEISKVRLLSPFKVQDASKEERQAALFNATCVHASFGDIELAQITLRGAACHLTARPQPAQALNEEFNIEFTPATKYKFPLFSPHCEIAPTAIGSGRFQQL